MFVDWMHVCFAGRYKMRVCTVSRIYSNFSAGGGNLILECHMKKAIAATLIAFGIAFMGLSAGLGWHDPKANTAFFIGTLIPGFLILLVGLIVRRWQAEPRMKLWIPMTIGSVLAFLLFSVQLAVPFIVFAADAGEPWTYTSTEHDFSITLPSPHWKKVDKAEADAAFANIRAFVGVSAFPGTERLAYERHTEDFHRTLDKVITDRIEDLVVKRGETPSGNPIVYWKTVAKNGNHKMYLAAAWVFIADKKLAVKMMMEGALQMLSKSGRKAEMDYFDQTAKSIRESIR
jgi:hypothetical protein